MIEIGQKTKFISSAAPRVAVTADPPAEQLRAVTWQTVICWLALLPFGGFLVLLLRLSGYSIENRAETRRRYADLVRGHKRPILLCSNHLTFIDSALIIWGLGSNWWYLRNYRAFPWNLPAGDFFKKKLKYHVTLYLMKCIFIHRDGSNEHKNSIVDLCRYLLRRGQSVLIFPEGQRSRSGQFAVDQLTLGAARLANSVTDCQVVCLYLRSPAQNTFSNYPPKNARFTLDMELVELRTEKTGKEAYIELTRQIGTTIARMEARFYARHGDAN